MDKKTKNQHDFCYQFSKDGSDLLFGGFIIRDKKDEPCFPAIFSV